MRIVVCEQDAFLRAVLESLVASTGHELAGVADTTVSAVGLIEAARPDAVVVDLSVGYDTDFDMIAAAGDVGARAIVFSHQADADLLDRYAARPTFVPKPDLSALEDVLVRLPDTVHGPAELQRDRRRRPTRKAAGPVPTGVTDARAFFEAVNEAEPGDAMLSLETAAGAEDVTGVLRGTDRLLAFPGSVRVLLPGGGEDGVQSLLDRLVAADILPAGCATASIDVAPGERGGDAFARLKRTVPAAP